MHPIKGYGPSLQDQGIGPDDAPLWSAVRNCDGCQIEYDRETGEATILFCADHDNDEREWELAEARKESERLGTALAGAEQQIATAVAEIDRLRECLEGMCWQFGVVIEENGERWLGTMGLSNLEWAFEVLRWEEPHPFPAAPER